MNEEKQEKKGRRKEKNQNIRDIQKKRKIMKNKEERKRK